MVHVHTHAHTSVTSQQENTHALEQSPRAGGVSAPPRSPWTDPGWENRLGKGRAGLGCQGPSGQSHPTAPCTLGGTFSEPRGAGGGAQLRLDFRGISSCCGLAMVSWSRSGSLRDPAATQGDVLGGPGGWGGVACLRPSASRGCAVPARPKGILALWRGRDAPSCGRSLPPGLAWQCWGRGGSLKKGDKSNRPTIKSPNRGRVVQ